jgi:hypothetical protein
VKSGTDLGTLMSQINHPNREGHEIVARLLGDLFLEATAAPAEQGAAPKPNAD